MVNTRPDSILVKKLNTFLPLAPDEVRFLAGIESNRLDIKRGKQLTQEGQTGHKAFVFQSGWACSCKDLPNGGRQVISFPIAGDCVGLRSVLLRTADHSFSALTDAVVSPVGSLKFRRQMLCLPRALATAPRSGGCKPPSQSSLHQTGPPQGCFDGRIGRYVR